ncbi:flagellar basal body rod protein FlgC [Ralstonia pseudosolanacearum]|uniref:flagellar basal body rod protein FlgC n=1 Tax=Ralstonia pseudosolanacearum TaxID=1310165 RepID=UPI0006BDBA58|nr:flagellar basal body rod protein FlgC [Ralstonia pseudosolanacearum]AKZ29130.1 flagellar basal-body rod protein FlgC [Ralstonia solanacearum]MBX9432204.1 flagellar basal body rod protein FlgC [Ralstonia pseudosolanacearum]MCF1441334.1 flagellar basal body rod protein FlgC [Ralstonia solanacearum]BCL94189.1 flagellar basal-body rod protein FlgC [Ralstonia solanacearum]BCL99339.1 flagellar basal-body rod protein FlgC [Ralstonia solanacearum]
MDYARAFAISAAGMAVERTRVDVAALNLANANTISGAGGAQYQPLRVVAQATPLNIGQDAGPAVFSDRVEQGLDALESVPVSLPQARTEPTGAQPRMVYEPGNPFANDKGFVAYQGVDTATEMVTLMSALRAYEANVAAMNTARTLALKALDIGGAS